MLSEGKAHIKLSQPGPEVVRNLNDPYIACIARGSSTLPQAGLVVASSTKDIYAICMTKTTPDTSLGPQTNE